MSEENKVVLSPGDKAPDFCLPSDQGETVCLSELQGQKVILYFYPKDNTPGCTTQACEYNAHLPTLQARGVRVIGISPDSVKSHEKFRSDYDLRFTLLSDPDRKVFDLYGAFGNKMNYGKVIRGIIRSTFVVDENGLIQSASYNVKAKGNADRIVNSLEQ